MENRERQFNNTNEQGELKAEEVYRIIDSRGKKLEFKKGDYIFVNGLSFVFGETKEGEGPNLDDVIVKSQEFSSEHIITKTRQEYIEYNKCVINKKQKKENF